MKSSVLHRLLIIALAVMLLYVSPSANRLFAQSVFYNIEVPEGRTGQTVDLQVKGKGLSQVDQIDKVKFDGVEVKVIHFEIKSDDRLPVRIQIPENAQPVGKINFRGKNALRINRIFSLF